MSKETFQTLIDPESEKTHRPREIIVIQKKPTVLYVTFGTDEVLEATDLTIQK